MNKRAIKNLHKLTALHDGLDVVPNMRGIPRDLRTQAYPVASGSGRVTWYKQVMITVDSERRPYYTLATCRVRRPANAVAILSALLPE
jgi:hypothetical protein